MGNNVSVVTSTAKAVTDETVDGMIDNIARHTLGDWDGHNVVQVYNVPFTEPVTGHIVSDYSLRVLLTDAAGNDVAVMLPAILTGQTVSTGSLPYFLRQPLDQAVAAGNNAQFDVAVASQTAVTFQWQNGTNDIPGATDSIYVLTGISGTDAGDYRVVATNTNGTTVSDPATLIVL